MVEEVPRLLIDFTWAVLIAPKVQELFIHAPRTKLSDLAHVLEDFNNW